MKPRKGWLKEARNIAGASQKDLISGLGAARATVDNYEKGNPQFSDEQLDRLRRILLLPHLEGERDFGSYKLLDYEDRATLASVSAGDHTIWKQVESSLMRAFSSARQCRKAHLFLVRFKEFLDEIHAFAPPPKARTTFPYISLRDLLTQEYFSSLEAKLELQQREVLSIATAVKKNVPKTRPGSKAVGFTVRERESLKRELEEKQAAAGVLAERVRARSVSDRDLTRYYQTLRRRGEIENFGEDLNKVVELPSQNRWPIDVFWERLFEDFVRIGSAPEGEWENLAKSFWKVGYEPDDVEWEHFVEDYDPKLVVQIYPDHSLRIKVIATSPAEAGWKLLYVHGDRLPLDLDSFGKVPKRGDEPICVVKFRGDEPFRYFQLLACSPDDQWHRSCIYAIDRQRC